MILLGKLLKPCSAFDTYMLIYSASISKGKQIIYNAKTLDNFRVHVTEFLLYNHSHSDPTAAVAFILAAIHVIACYYKDQ